MNCISIVLKAQIVIFVLVLTNFLRAQYVIEQSELDIPVSQELFP